MTRDEATLMATSHTGRSAFAFQTVLAVNNQNVALGVAALTARIDDLENRLEELYTKMAALDAAVCMFVGGGS